MSKQTFGLFAAPVLVIVVGIAAARIFEKEDLTRQIAVFAAVVAAGGVLVNYFKTIRDYLKEEHEKKKKAEDSKEKVAATAKIAFPRFSSELRTRLPGFDPGFVGVELYNCGAVLVAIKSVTLFIKNSEGDFKVVLNPNDGSNTKLEPKDHTIYSLPVQTNYKTDWFVNHSPDMFWIVVETYGSGEVARVPGKEILNVVNDHISGK